MTRSVFSASAPPIEAKKAPLQGRGGNAVVGAPRTPGGRVGRLIWNYLRGIFPREELPKSIAVAIREKPATVRKELRRLEESGHVVLVAAGGWYRAWADPALWTMTEKPEPSCHGLQFTTLAPPGGGLGVPRGATQAKLSGATARGWAADESNDTASRREWVMGRPVTLQAYGTGTVIVNVSASRDPVKFADWSEFAAELRGLCRAFGIDLDSPSSRLVNVEFNADWRTYFLGGMKRMKLSSVSRAWGQIYQKHRDALRLELRVSPKELKFTEAAQALVALTEYQPGPGPFARADPEPAPARSEPAAYGMEVA